MAKNIPSTHVPFHLLALSLIEGIGNVKINQLLSHFKSAENVFQASKTDFYEVKGFNISLIEAILSKSTFQQAEEEINFCLQHHLEIITYQDERYPLRLLSLEDRPLILFTKGNIHGKIKKALSIVGTRKSTEYGNKFLEILFDELKTQKDLVTISGLALGVDTKAHGHSIKANIPTLAVMAFPLNKIYPTTNQKLAIEIIEHEGGWITESVSREKMVQGLFPRRNRIIAALCDALLVVETDIKGGSIITANIANDYHKDVYALPGRYQDPHSRGCNYLIKNRKAEMILSVDDFIEDLGWKKSSNKKLNPNLQIEFEGNDEQKFILDIIRRNPGIDVDMLSFQSKKSTSQLAESLIVLELEGIIRTLPGKKYEIV
jgi:DNA processing protein